MIKKLSQLSGMPQMKAAFTGWMQKISLIVITQTVDGDGFVDSTEKLVTFKGTVQPLDPEEIKLKPDGQRSWEWLQIHCFAGSLNLTTNDRVISDGVKYKIMNVYDWSRNNYIEYHLVKDFYVTIS